MRVGIIKLSALGDIIVAMSFLPFLKDKGYHIDWFLDRAFAQIAQNSPYIDRIHALPLKENFKNKNFRQIYSDLMELKSLPPYDLLIDMQGLLKSAILGKCIKSKVFRGFGFGSCKESLASLLYDDKIHIRYDKNILKRNAEILDLPLFSSPINAFAFTSQASSKIASLLHQAPPTHKKVLLILEASKLTKMYPIDLFLKLSLSLQGESITCFALHHAHTSQAQELCDRSEVILLPRLNLDEIKALIAGVDAVIGGDTGITHLAWAMNKPSITLYGNTPLKRFKLKGDRNLSLTQNPNACYGKDDFSIRLIDPDCVRRALLEIL